ncbi:MULTISPECIES: hypothetical protein [Rhizobium/Agrobacterium group]|uniref:hypothetical protein n=1 Tax=Rhizobium/Agrobacterium group TaxID=227290 RepID=UPI0012E713F8|nr:MULTISPECIES: hypothetical protein [Rhizobium/Agrobacterium group]MUZ66042.1 hypothetical protein [Agrobacterium vitis]
MSKTTNNFLTEVREHAIRMVVNMKQNISQGRLLCAAWRVEEDQGRYREMSRPAERSGREDECPGA